MHALFAGLIGVAACGGPVQRADPAAAGLTAGQITPLQAIPFPGYCLHVLNDPHNCGGCGHDCQGGACFADTCQPVVLASNVCPTSIAVDATNVYFTHSSQSDWAVRKVAKTGASAPIDLASGAIPMYGPAQTADGVTAWNGIAYWIAWQSGSSQLQSVSIAGGPITTLDNYTNSLARMVTRTLAANGTGVYWANEDNGVRRITSSGVDMISPGLFLWNGGGGLPYPVTIAVDANYAYFTSNDPPTLPQNLLNRVPIDGGPIVTVGAVGAVVHAVIPLSDTAIATDGVNEYWASSHQAPGMILGVPVGGGSESVAALTVNPSTIVTSLAVDASGVYWTENDASGVVAGKSFASGLLARTYISNQSYPFAVAVDDHAIYWVNAGTSYSTYPTPLPSTCTGSVMKIAK